MNHSVATGRKEARRDGGKSKTPSRATRQLEILAIRSLELADRVKAGEIDLPSAVDVAWEAAVWSGLTETVGDDIVQTVLSEAFAQVPR